MDFLNACFVQNHDEITGLICLRWQRFSSTLISMVLSTCKLKVQCVTEYNNCYLSQADTQSYIPPLKWTFLTHASCRTMTKLRD